MKGDIMIGFASLSFLFNSVIAFTCTSSINSYHHPYQQPTLNNVKQVVSLQLSDDDSSDPFNRYTLSEEQTDVAIKDIRIGDGYTVTSDYRQLLQVKFTAKLMGSKFTANIKEFDVKNMVFRTGEERCLPGLEEGLQGMKVGGSRLIRVPPNKGYADKWFRGVVPPNSHLEFDCTLLNIAQTPIEEFKMKLEQFGYERAIGAGVCFAYLALSPMLEKNGIL